jgi:hypothetical protein
MNIMKKITALCLTFVLVMTACADLDIENSNAPDQSRALASPSDVESLIRSTFLTLWQALHVQGAGFLGMTMADAQTSSWGNFGMREITSEPRVAIDNKSSWGYATTLEGPWYDLYGAISSARDGLVSLKAGQEGGKNFLSTADDDKRAEIFAKWVLAVANAQVALWYDKGFYVDGDTDFSAAPSTVSYSELMTSALTALEAVATEAQANSSLIIPYEWMQISSMTMDDLAKVTHSMLARYKAGVARTPAERAAVDWADVKSHASQGGLFAPVGDGVYWWSRTQYWSGVSRSWGRADYKMIGPADKSNGYTNWLGDGSDATIQGRKAFTLDTDDKRITGPLDADGLQTEGAYIGNEYRTRLIASRGTYHQTYYYLNKQRAYAATLLEPMHDVTQAELDSYLIEAALRGGDAATAVTLINKTRVDIGGLSAATSDTPLGSPTDKPNALDGSSLWAMFKYETIIETVHTNPWLPFTQRRGLGDLVPNTPLHFPIPGKELEILLMENYTFGGGGDGSAARMLANPDSKENNGFSSRGFYIEWDKVQHLNSGLTK